MRRIALISDVHGNRVALDAVLADIDASDVGELYCLGDLVGYGPDPAGAVARVREGGIPSVRGNYDDGVGFRKKSCGCFYATPKAKADGDASYKFTDASLSEADHAWLASLPELRRLDLGDARVVLAHGSPRKINEYLMPDRPETQLVRLAEGAEADVVCVGHVHVPYHRVMDGSGGRRVHYVNAGSVGKPKDGDPRACWVEVVVLGAGEPAPLVQHLEVAGGGETSLGSIVHRVAYDVDRVASAVIAAGLPASLAEGLRTAT